MELKMMDPGKLSTGQGMRYGADEKTFAELKASIAAKGIVYPLIASSAGKKHRVIDGTRRLRAITELGWAGNEKIPVLVVTADDGQAAETALIANAVRENLDGVSLAEAVNLLVNNYDKSTEEVAGALGKSKQYVRRLLKIFSLPEDVLKALREGKLTIAHAHWLTKLIDDPGTLKNVFEKAIADDLAHRDLETLIGAYLQKNEARKSDYAFFTPTTVTTKAGSRLRFEPRRRSIRLELNLLHDDIDDALSEVKRQLEKLEKRHLRVVG